MHTFDIDQCILNKCIHCFRSWIGLLIKSRLHSHLGSQNSDLFTFLCVRRSWMCPIQTRLDQAFIVSGGADRNHELLIRLPPPSSSLSSFWSLKHTHTHTRTTFRENDTTCSIHLKKPSVCVFKMHRAGSVIKSSTVCIESRYQWWDASSSPSGLTAQPGSQWLRSAKTDSTSADISRHIKTQENRICMKIAHTNTQKKNTELTHTF